MCGLYLAGHYETIDICECKCSCPHRFTAKYINKSLHIYVGLQLFSFSLCPQHTLTVSIWSCHNYYLSILLASYCQSLIQSSGRVVSLYMYSNFNYYPGYNRGQYRIGAGHKGIHTSCLRFALFSTTVQFNKASCTG